MIRRKRQALRTAPPTWWLRCLVIVLACLQVVAPTWHVCAMGASGPAPAQGVSMPHCACSMPQTLSQQPTLANLPADDFCLARLLQHVLGNSQFQLVLDFTSHTVATFGDGTAIFPPTGNLPVQAARGPPSYLLS